MPVYKSLTWDAVRETAFLLMAVNGTTTTLEVKNYLRQKGYWALQAEVSERMYGLARQEGWTVHSTGGYRIYASPLQEAAFPTYTFFVN